MNVYEKKFQFYHIYHKTKIIINFSINFNTANINKIEKCKAFQKENDRVKKLLLMRSLYSLI